MMELSSPASLKHLRASSRPYLAGTAVFAVCAAFLVASLVAGCSEPNDRCNIDRRSYPDRAANPANPCEVCSPALNPNDWTPLGDGAECGIDHVCHENACKQVCFVGAHRVAPGEQHPLELCQECVTDFTGKSGFEPSADGAECGDDGRRCLRGHCVDACFIDGVVYDEGLRNPRNPCRQCLTEQSTTSWSVGADGPFVCPDRAAFCLGGTCTPGCFIDGDAVPLGTSHPTEPCLVCPSYGTYGWSALPDRTVCGAALECRSGACVPRRLDLVPTTVGEGNHFAAFASSAELLVGGDGGLWRSDDEGDGEGKWKVEPELMGTVLHLARKPGTLSAVLALDESGALWQGGFGARWAKSRDGFVGARAFWSASDGSAMIVVGNAGSVWSGTSVENLESVESGSESNLLDVHGVSATEVWMVGEAGTVLRFDGVAFLPVETNVTTNLHAVRVVGGRVIAVGADATVVRSDDGGNTWEVAHPPDALGADLHALGIAGDDLVAVGAHGTFLLSSDGGETWRQQELAVFETLTSVGAEMGRVVAAGTGGRVVIGR